MRGMLVHLKWTGEECIVEDIVDSKRGYNVYHLKTINGNATIECHACEILENEEA